MAGIEFVVARIFELARPGLVGVGLGGRALAIEAFRVDAWSAENRIALGAAIDGGKRASCLFERPVRLALVFGGEFVRIADRIARLNDRQRRAVFVHRAQRPRCEASPVDPAGSADQLTAGEGAGEFGRFLLRLRR